MLGNIGNLFVKCMPRVTKGHLYHLLRISDYDVMYRQVPSEFCETPEKVTNWVTDPLIVGSVKVNFLSYRYRADKSTIFGMRGLWGLTINSGRGAMLKYL